jgi:hypothetical protein
MERVFWGYHQPGWITNAAPKAMLGAPLGTAVIR